MAEHNLLGIKGEEIAQRYLEQKGLVVLRRNWRHRKAEVDIVALDGDQIVFVEVKTRTPGQPVAPHESLRRRKTEMLLEAADAYMRAYEPDREARIDFVAVFVKGDTHRVEHTRDAVTPSW